MGNVQDSESNDEASAVSPAPHSRFPPVRPQRPAPAVPGGPLPGASPYPLQPEGAEGDYEMLLPNYAPNRPAPRPPTNRGYSTSSLAVFNGLEDVPFVLNPKLTPRGGETTQLPVIKSRTMQQLMKDYNYDFSVERQS